MAFVGDECEANRQGGQIRCCYWGTRMYTPTSATDAHDVGPGCSTNNIQGKERRKPSSSERTISTCAPTPTDVFVGHFRNHHHHAPVKDQAGNHRGAVNGSQLKIVLRESGLCPNNPKSSQSPKGNHIGQLVAR